MEDGGAAWPASVEEERAWRERHYTQDDTPLSPEARKAFVGLSWWPIDARWRVRGVTLQRHEARVAGKLPATGEDAVALDEVGAFSFTLAGAPVRLRAYQPAPGETDEDYILIPFRDATSGKETYGAGRYLDLELVDGDVYELDFNRAYHPYCAFDDAWACVLPPPENRLPFRVVAGERF